MFRVNTMEMATRVALIGNKYYAEEKFALAKFQYQTAAKMMQQINQSIAADEYVKLAEQCDKELTSSSRCCFPFKSR